MTGRPREWTDEKLIDLGKELVDHCKKDNVWHLTSFEIEKDLYDGCLDYLYSNYPLFLHYYTRALRVLGNKLLSKSIEGGPDRWVIKTFMPRYLNVRKWVQEDVEMEALAKAKAAKSVNMSDVDPRVLQFITMLGEQKNDKSPK